MELHGRLYFYIKNTAKPAYYQSDSIKKQPDLMCYMKYRHSIYCMCTSLMHPPCGYDFFNKLLTAHFPFLPYINLHSLFSCLLHIEHAI